MARWEAADTVSVTWPSGPKYSMVPMTARCTTQGPSAVAPHVSTVPAGS
jgi:hypothetical protein